MKPVYQHPIKAIIFDNDGTLMDTEWAYSWAHKQLFGRDLEWDLKGRLMGRHAVESMKITCEYYGLNDDPNELVTKRRKLMDKCWDDIHLMPGADDLVKTAKARGVHCCIATSSKRTVFVQKASKTQDFVALMDHITCGDDVARGKPDPDIFLAALHKYDGIAPENALVFEDSPLGIKAANLAGMPSVFVPDPNLNVETSLAEQDAHPTLIIKSLVDFDFNSFNWEKC